MVRLSFLSILFVAVIRLCFATTEPIGTYWGQNVYEGSSYETCSSGIYKFVNIAFLTRYGNGQTPELDLSDHCNSTSNGCPNISSHIRICQEMGINVMLSLLGGSGNYSLASASDAKNVSNYLWNSFLGGRSSSYSCPLGNASLDVIDFYIGIGSTKYMNDLAQALPVYNKVGTQYYLSASPQCPYPNASDANALNISPFDYIFVQYYYNPSCQYISGSTVNLSNSWNQWTSSASAAILFGLPASPDEAAGGFIPPDVLVSQILPVVKRSPNYGGLMLWSRYL